MSKFKRLLSHSAKRAKKDNLLSLASASKIGTLACLPQATLLREFNTTAKHGLTTSEAHKRLLKFGKNEAVTEKKLFWPIVLLNNFRDPLSLLLVVLALVSFFTGNAQATCMIGAMVLLSVFLRFFQEIKADKAARALKAMVHTTAKVIRNGKLTNLPLSSLAPGDIV
ncbi:MAG: hypothetical protein HY979_03555, partial [Candidatus Magasanikbacteria bacterium]|nr:hypothetical protein [Candidatus Magasanikbacteria bacterium]